MEGEWNYHIFERLIADAELACGGQTAGRACFQVCPVFAISKAKNPSFFHRLIFLIN